MVTRDRSPLRTLSGQLLVMQLGIVTVVLLAVGGVSLAQSGSEFSRTESDRLSGLAERLASSPLVRTRLETYADNGTIGTTELATLVDSISAQAADSTAMITDTSGNVIVATDGRQRGRLADPALANVTRGSSWSGELDIDRIPSIVAVAPVLSDEPANLGEVVGTAVVSIRIPSLRERLLGASRYLLIFLGIASGVGIAGSWLIAQRIKRQTLGMEPPEIAALAEYRQAVLGGIAEGIIALDPQQRITLINNAGRDLLDLGPEAVGRPLSELGLSSRLLDVLTGPGLGRDQVVIRRGRVLVMNRTEVTKENQHLGSVTTLRDRTELTTMERELGTFQSTTELLRAQAHEFDNRLHTISGLIQIGDHDQVVQYVDALSKQRAALDFSVTNRLRDAPVAALVLAKASAADERRVRLRVSQSSSLDHLSAPDSADLATVIGNLLDNAIDAAATGDADKWVELDIQHRAQSVRISVRDSGPGVAPELAAEVFTHGFTTKAAIAGERGIGLALTRRLCRERHGDVDIVGLGSDARFLATMRVSAS